jgi:hypothetical protein
MCYLDQQMRVLLMAEFWQTCDYGVKTLFRARKAHILRRPGDANNTQAHERTDLVIGIPIIYSDLMAVLVVLSTT